MEKKLYRSRNDKMVAGVCAGLADYFGIDASLVRLGFVFLLIPGGMSIWAYIIAAIIVPEAPADYGYEHEVYDKDGQRVNVDPEQTQKKTRLILGYGLVGVGIIMMMQRFIGWFDGGLIFAVCVIGVGVLVLFKDDIVKRDEE